MGVFLSGGPGENISLTEGPRVYKGGRREGPVALKTYDYIHNDHIIFIIETYMLPKYSKHRGVYNESLRSHDHEQPLPHHP